MPTFAITGRSLWPEPLGPGVQTRFVIGQQATQRHHLSVLQRPFMIRFNSRRLIPSRFAISSLFNPFLNIALAALINLESAMRIDTNFGTETRFPPKHQPPTHLCDYDPEPF